ncbi:cadherin domain-containing protein [Shinella curvata]|nr:cadherin domain-containing protein [Shinella curvata]
MAEIEQAKIDALKDGLNQALAKIEQAMATQVYAEKLPLVGAGLKSAYEQGQAWMKSITALKDSVFAALDAIDTAGERLDTVVASAINNALANSGFIGSGISATVDNGDVLLSLSTNKFISGSISLASDLGIAGLGVETSGTATATLGYAINLSVGVDANGFYVMTGQANEIQASLTVSGSAINAVAELGFLNFNATDAGSYVSAMFAIDLKDSDGRIRLTELDNDLLDATLNGSSHIEVALSADGGSELLPSISATLVVDWAFDVGTAINPDDDNSGFGMVPQVKVKEIHMDLGSFMTDFVQPALQQLEPILKPINQVLAVLNSEVKALKSIPEWQTLFDKTGDGKVTFVDLIKLASPGADLTPLTKFIDLAQKVLDWAEFLADADFGADSYTIGDFIINGDVRALNFQIGSASTTFGGFVDDLGTLVGALQGDSWSDTSSGGDTGKEIFEAIIEGGDFSVPILTDPTQIIKLILGGNADLMEIDLPEVDFSFTNTNMLTFSIFPGINVKLGGGVGLGFDLAFGYDTRGLLGTGSAIDGFYIIDGAGPEVTFSASITLGVALDAFIASLYGGGDITGTVDFDLADDVGSTVGRIYVDEMAALLSSNPFQIFETSGKITAGFTAYATVFWGEVWRHTSPRVTLGSFSFDDPRTDDATTPAVLPDLGEKVGADLMVNIGDRASLRAVPDKTDGAESIEIGAGSGGVTIFGFGEQQSFSGITRIIAAGGLLGDQIVMGDDVSGIRAEFSGGAGEDVLVGGAMGDRLDGGSERDYLEGNGGEDELIGGAGDDILVGGAGGDTIDGGADNDIVSYFNSSAAVVINLATGINTGGDAAGDTISNVEIIEGSSHGDTITGAGVAHTLAGLGGSDVLTGTDGNDVLIGNAGNDTLDGLGGQDILIGGLGDDIYYVDDLDDAVQENRMQEIAVNVSGGTDLIYASIDYTLDVADRQDIENLTLLGLARIGTGNGLANLMTGTSDGDTLNGLGGIDELHGGGGADTLNGGDQIDTLFGEAGDDILDGGSGADDLRGGADNDTYRVDDAGDTVVELEDEGADTVRASVNYVLTAGAHVEVLATSDDNGTTTRDLTGNELSQLLTGDKGNNTLEGRGGADIFVGGAGTDTVTYRSSAVGVTIDRGVTSQVGGEAEGDIIGSDVEIIEGSTKNDVFHGTTQADHFRGLAGDDTFFGNGGIDTMVGGAGDDTYHVDSLSDIVDESSASGGAGRDRIISSINYSLVGNEAVEDLSLSGSARIGTGNGQANRIEGTSGGDTLDGRQGSDTLVGKGGSDHYWFDSAGDQVEELANEGTDTIHLATTDFVTPTQQDPDPLLTFSLDTSWGANVENVTVEDNVRRINITGNGLANTLIGNDRNNTLAGLGGNDRLVVGNGRDIVDGGSGADTLVLDWSGIGDSMEVFGLSEASDGTGYGGNIYRTYYGDNSSLNRLDFAGIDHFDMTLGSGGDIIRTGDGNDRVIGNSGSDYINTGKGVDVVDGGNEADGTTGSDRWEADKSAATLAMTINLTASSSSYVIGGLTGTVTRIEALTLKTGSGSDVITTRRDFLQDVVTTGAGADTIKIAGGRDTIDMGAGDDKLILDWSNIGDSMEVFNLAKASDGTGYTGNIYRTYYGDNSSLNRLDFAGIDHFDMTLGSGGDIIRTGDGNDRVIGNAGNDYINTGKGVDVVDGGNEADGTAGSDRWEADKSAATLAMTINLTASSSSYVIGGLTGSVTRIEALTLKTGSGSDVLTTRSDFLEDVLETNDGNDTVKIAGGRDNVSMGKGIDTLIINWSAITESMELFNLSKAGDGTGYSGNIYRTYYGDNSGLNRADFSGVDKFDITFGSGDDIIRTGDGDDKVSSGAGNDFIDTDTGADIVIGGTGNDRWKAIQSAMTSGFTLDLTDTTKTAAYTVGGRTGSVTGIEMLTLTTGSGDDVITTRSQFFEDQITTGLGNDRIKIVGGRDTVDAGGGSDTLVLDWGSITENMEIFNLSKTAGLGYGGNIFRTYYGDSSSLNRLDFAGIDHFDLTFGSGSDIIRTGDGNDRVIGKAGNDYINTGAGADIVDGGSETNGSAGQDRWEADKSAATVAMAINLNASSSTYVIGGLTGSITRIEALTLKTGSGSDTITTRREFLEDSLTTGNGNDTVKIAGGRDNIDMGAGTDTLVIDWSNISDSMEVFNLAKATGGAGYSGNIFRTYYGDASNLNRADFAGVNTFDVTFGAGNDIIRTGDGADRLSGGAGDDSLSGGAGADTFIYTSGKDTITDFQLGVDKLTGSGLAAVKSVAQLLTMVDKTDLANTVITLSAGNVLTLAGIGWKTLTGASFVNTAPTITSNSGAASVALATAENSTALLATVKATDPESQPITYAVSGADAAFFSINASTGALKFKAGVNFEKPADANKDNVYSVIVKAIDGFSASDSQTFNVTVTNAADAPVITSNGGGSSATISVAENSTVVTTVVARDDDAGAKLTYAISGTDAARFSIDKASGRLIFKSAPDFETPTDKSGNNIYDLIVSATDDKGLVDKQTLAVKVTDVKGITFNGLASGETKSGTVEADTLKGNGGIDRLKGLAGNDVLDGGAGSDVLEGGTGRDTFVFSTPLGSSNVDTLISFSAADDTIQLNKSIFSAIAGTKVLSTDQFVANIQGVATDTKDRIVYDTSDGKLYYDADGSHAGKATLFAILDTKPSLSALDFALL